MSDSFLLELNWVTGYNTKGYVPGNVQWVCREVNFMKGAMLEPNFLKWVKAVYDYRLKGVTDDAR